MQSNLERPFHHYGSEFNTNSAALILPYLKDKFSFESIIDIGCGPGYWLLEAERLGISNMLGMDGKHVSDNREFLLDSRFFKSVDLETELEINDNSNKFELAICLEVAEHLQEQKASSLVKFICSKSDVILFSAAIPGQTGENHKNEQYPEYWQKLFGKQNYVFLDPFREAFWQSDNVEWWYRQNLFLVVHQSRLSDFSFWPKWNGNVYIAPELLELYVAHCNSVNADKLPYLAGPSNQLKKPLSLLQKISRLFK